MAVMQLGSFKALGLDRFPNLFYHPIWETFQMSINDMVALFFSVNDSMKSLNCTNIVPIPNVPNSKIVAQFRHISLCIISYQILSKLMAYSPLQPYQPSLKYFCPKQKNLRQYSLAHEAFHYLQLKKSKKVCELGLKLGLALTVGGLLWSCNM